ncbi:MAG: PolC-type DNA polymerase III [Firmicutes bacterium]|nr:PolC-type DNA polymerase III [Bacillota bacterium]
MDELKRFLNSINFEYTDDLQDTEIMKVVLNRETKVYNVYLKSKYVLSYELVTDLFNHAKRGINGKDKCYLEMVYDNITTEDLEAYIKSILNAVVFEHPSLMGLENSFTKEEDNTIYLEVGSNAEVKALENYQDEIITHLRNYGLGDFLINISINEQIKEEIKKEIEASKEVKPEKKEDSPVIFGFHKDGEVTQIKNIMGEQKNIIIEGYVFGIDNSERKGQKATAYIINLKVSDKTDSFLVKFVRFKEEEYKQILKGLKVGKWFRIVGNVEMDNYLRQMVLNGRSIEAIKSKDIAVTDEEEEKRVELHVHTMMSAMDGVIEAKKLVKHAKSLGHKAVAVTDHDCLQSYPELYHAVCDINYGIENEEDKFKVIYGAEMSIVNNENDLIHNLRDYDLLETEFVVFDTETTGFTPYTDQIIEIGAVKIKNGEITDRFDELINPGRKLPEKIIELTNITDEMLEDKDTEENVTKRFMEFIGDLPMVAHNAKFDIGFISAAYNKYNLGEFSNTVLDTMSMARMLYPNWKNHKLSTLVKQLEVPWDEDAHHRADYDSEGTAIGFYKMCKTLYNRNIETTKKLYDSVDLEELLKFSRPFHMSVLVKNRTGLKNLFKIISFANTKYLFKGDQPKLPRDELNAHREGMLFGSGCVNGEIFEAAFTKEDEELAKMMQYYDYIEVQPPEVYSYLVDMESSPIKSLADIYTHIKKIVKVAEEAGVMVCATSDAHHLTREDKIYRDIIANQRFNGKLHPLNKRGITIPDMHFYTTREMLDAFSFLGEEKAKEIVVINPNKIADQCEIVEVIIETGGVPFSPKIENSAQIVEDMVYNKAKDWYGDPLPDNIRDRIEQELKGIIGGGFDVIYLIAQKLVKKSNDDGFLVGSRGSVGSSFVATMMGITEVNPLPSHYRCPNCKHSIFKNDDGEDLAIEFGIGFDLPDKDCPKCGVKMIKDGEDMPFATFLGFNADKVPDIDLNFSDLNQAAAHEYTKVLFGEDNVYRAGTIGTVAEKTAFGFVKGYCEDKNIIMRGIEVERLAAGCVGVKRTTGQHPGGIVVIPGYMDVYDFTPYQYPAEDVDAAWRTTHFDYHAIDQDVLKLDILGHTDPTQLRMLQDLTGIDVKTVPFDDKETMGLFLSPEPLGVTKEQIMNDTGTLGVPEFGTNFTIGMLRDTKPTTFGELIKISGLSHGTDVWLGNAQELIRKGVVPFKEVIGCRDDIMVFLMQAGMEPLKAFKIMEFVRKGKASKDPEGWSKHKAAMEEAGIPDWYIGSCEKIKYMFPKAHASAYVMSAFRIAWFKVHRPAEYYASYFSTRFDDFEIETMIKGYDAIKARINDIIGKGYEATSKETSLLETLKLALEATARGFKFGNIDVERSLAKNYVIDEDGKTLISPFRTLDGLGDAVANQIVEERNKKSYYCIEDFQNRGKVNASTMEKLRNLGVFKGMPESAQLSLF